MPFARFPRGGGLCAAFLLAVMSVTSAEAKVHRFPATGVRAGNVVFQIRGIAPGKVVAGYVAPRLHRRDARVPLGTRRVRRAVRRGRLVVGLRRLGLRRALRGRRLSALRRRPLAVIRTDEAAPDTPGGGPPPGAGCAKVTQWVAPQVQQSPASYLYTPVSDGQAALCVVTSPESVPQNAAANSYVPSDADLAAFRATKNPNGETQQQASWYPRHVTGRPGLLNPTTDDLIEWAAHKWGIPEDWLRAQAERESSWDQSGRGDRHTVTPDCYLMHPPVARIVGTFDVYESLGIMQVKWRCGNADGAGAEPLRWKSTAFNVDFEASVVRFYYDNPYGKRSSWNDAAYHPLDAWGALGAWFSPYPYNNADAQAYIGEVKQNLASRGWPQ